jgi:hypothetical protein
LSVTVGVYGVWVAEDVSFFSFGFGFEFSDAFVSAVMVFPCQAGSDHFFVNVYVVDVNGSEYATVPVFLPVRYFDGFSGYQVLKVLAGFFGKVLSFFGGVDVGKSYPVLFVIACKDGDCVAVGDVDYSAG